MRVRLKERRLEAAEVISFTFDLGGQPFEYKPGQYAAYRVAIPRTGSICTTQKRFSYCYCIDLVQHVTHPRKNNCRR